VRLVHPYFYTHLSSAEMETEPIVICFTFQDALNKNQKELSDAVIALDRFMSANPESVSDRNPDFRYLRQQVKRLQLQRNELLEQSKQN